MVVARIRPTLLADFKIALALLVQLRWRIWLSWLCRETRGDLGDYTSECCKPPITTSHVCLSRVIQDTKKISDLADGGGDMNSVARGIVAHGKLL